MRAPFLLVSLAFFLSIQLALQPIAGAFGAGPGLTPGPSSELAAAGKETGAQGKRAAPKKKKQRAKKAKERKAKQKQEAKQKQKAKRGRGGKQRVKAAPRELTVTGRLPGAAARVAQAANPGERYVVLFADERTNSRAVTTALGERPGVIPTFVYEHAVKGFAAYLTPEAKAALEQDPRVASVTPDRQRHTSVQTMPTGINRVDADLNPTAAIDGGGPGVNVDIAIIDTGIDVNHPDLNVFSFADCSDDVQEGLDLDGHGTHVAGTAAAIDNGIGVVGVAPGARIWSMRVQDSNGIMFDSYIIACMDLVTFYASTPLAGQTIDVANMSLGGFFPEDRCGVGDAFNDAVCGMVNAGVTTVVAAGNESADAVNYNPANIDAVITVSALADSNGQPGGGGPAYADACTNPEIDDSLASFSNYGADVDIAAPGVGILSTFPTYLTHYCVPAAGVGYDILPGTSMASPHVAGAAGLLLAVNPNLTPEQVKAQLQASRENVAIPGDPDGINEGILNVGVPDTKGPKVTISGPASARVGQKVNLRVQASDPSGISRVILYRCEPGCKKVTQDGVAPYKFVRTHNQPGRVKYKIRVFDKAGNYTDKFKVIKIKPRR